MADTYSIVIISQTLSDPDDPLSKKVPSKAITLVMMKWHC